MNYMYTNILNSSRFEWKDDACTHVLQFTTLVLAKVNVLYRQFSTSCGSNGNLGPLYTICYRPRTSLIRPWSGIVTRL